VSSNIFSSDLKPDPLLRRAVTGTGLVAIAGGFAAILGLPFDIGWRALLAATWLAVGARDLWNIVQGFRHCSRIRIEHTGRLLVFDPGLCCTAATLSAGSVLLRNIGWLRFRTEDGRQHAELVHRKTVQSEDWRRLQVIWRHLGAGA
jgi:hypothetical protein